MKSRRFIKSLIAVLGVGTLSAFCATQLHHRRPNFVVILCDDLGYGDIQPFGGSIATPAISRMAKEGLVATDYYAPANLCTPSRAGLLTGRYAVRAGLAYEVILAGGDDRGLVAAIYPEVTSDMQKRLKLAQETFAPFKRGIPPFFQQMRNQPRKQD
jgi:hypothetical protein